MMKILLGTSLALNIILGYLLLTRKPEKEVIERVIIETHADREKNVHPEPLPAPIKTIDSKAASDKPTEEKLPEFQTFGPSEFQDAAEKMEFERTDFLTHKLGLSEEQIAQHRQLREEFYQKSAALWPKKPMQEPSFDQRRKMIDLEENFHKQLENLHGKKNWERYQKYRESYNEKGFKLQTEENRPFTFMGI